MIDRLCSECHRRQKCAEDLLLKKILRRFFSLSVSLLRERERDRFSDIYIKIKYDHPADPLSLSTTNADERNDVQGDRAAKAAQFCSNEGYEHCLVIEARANS